MQKRMLCLALSTVFSIGTALAVPQDQAPPPPQDQAPPPQDQMAPPDGGRQALNGERMLQAMIRQLNLTGDQQNQIRPIVQDERSQMMGLRNDSSLQPRDRMQKMKAIHEDASARIKAVLTPEQIPQFEKLQQQQRDRMRQGRQNRQGGPDGNPGAAPPPDGSNQ